MPDPCNTAFVPFKYSNDDTKNVTGANNVGRQLEIKILKAGYKNVSTIRRNTPAKVWPSRRHTYQTTRCHTSLTASLKQFSICFLHTIINHLCLAFRLRLMTGLPKSSVYSNALSLSVALNRRDQVGSESNMLTI
jgi:hypothetical protein